jgi:hypothetical protein
MEINQAILSSEKTSLEIIPQPFKEDDEKLF